MYVRTSHESFEEFNSHKIIQSLVREGSLPLELAEKITEEVGNRINKYQITYLTGSLIREMVNSVLLEHGHEEYRNKLARLGLPVFDIQNMLTNLDNVDNGAEGMLFNTGQRVFAEHLLTNILPKDVADAHLSGDLHITNTGTWLMMPDTIFANIKELISEGIDLGGKHMDVSRVPQSKQLDGIASALSVLVPLLSKEASQEVVLDGFTQLFARHSKSITEIRQKLTDVFASISTSSKYNNTVPRISIRLQLGTDTKIIGAVLDAYKNYAEVTPIPKIGLVVDHERGNLSDVSGILSEIISIGGRVMFTKGPTACSGVINVFKNPEPLSLALQSTSINLPRLAFESNKDETYFRARLALLMKPALDSMALRKRHMSDLTRRGLNPILIKNTQYMQRSSVSLVLNLVGLREAVFNILGYEDNREGRSILRKVIETAVDVASKKGKDLGIPAVISLVESDGSARFTSLDEVKYGKNSALNSIKGGTYSHMVVFEDDEIAEYNAKNERVLECNRLYKILNGGLLVTLNIKKDANVDGIKASIEKAAGLVPSFTPIKDVPICGECGFKDGTFTERCTSCKSSYML